MIRIFLVAFLMIAASRITSAGESSANDRYFAAMESRPATPLKVSIRKPPVKTKSSTKPHPSITFDGVYIRNASGDVIGMKTRCKPCRIGR